MADITDDRYAVRVTLDFEPAFPAGDDVLQGITQRLKDLTPGQVRHLMNLVGELKLAAVIGLPER